MQYNEREEATPYSTIGTDEAKNMIEAGARVIDVRRQDEWDRGHIPQAQLIPITGIYSFGKHLQNLNIPPEADVIFVCASGQRSAMASEIAGLLGLKKIYNLANGMNGWVGRHYPTSAKR